MLQIMTRRFTLYAYSEYDDPRDSTDTQLPGEYDLFDLMAKVTEENLHAPVDSGPPVGQEAL
ncbi:hypothetical protein DMP66_26960 [Klebsiella pneumoniae]|nr:hypothetical protein DMP66_26960 [Klebsiella pneumoniae]